MMADFLWSAVTIVLFHITVSSQNADIEQHDAWTILDEFECGDSASDRIIGGTNAALGQLPWIARLGYTGSMSEEVEWLCGGALFANRFVITAAHCLGIDSLYNLTHVRLGEYDITKDPDCHDNVCAPPVQDIKVKRFKKHDLFNKPPYQNDIALVELADPAVLNNYVTPVCLPRNQEQLKPLGNGDMLTVAGWGKTNMTTEEMADILQVLQVDYVGIPTVPDILPPVQQCILVLDPEKCSVFSKRFTLSSTQICAGGEKNKDACVGDSGGPLTKVFDTLDGPKHVLEGVVSFGPAVCGTGNLPGIYVSASSYMKWILDQINT